MSQRFSFTLEPVLQMRRDREREAMARVATLERERMLLEDRIRGLRADTDRAREGLRDCLGGPSRDMSVRGVRLQANALFSLNGHTHSGAIALAGVFKRLELARADLLRATTERRAVERLRERRLEEWRSQRRRAESKQDDEIASSASARSGRSGGSFGVEVDR